MYKRTIPGIQHVLRFCDPAGSPAGDMILDDAYDTGDHSLSVDILDPVTTYDMSGLEAHELLECVVVDGARAKEPDSIEVAKERCRESLMRLDPSYKRFLNPQAYPVGMERGLADLRQRLARAEHAGSGRARL